MGRDADHGQRHHDDCRHGGRVSKLHEALLLWNIELLAGKTFRYFLTLGVPPLYPQGQKVPKTFRYELVSFKNIDAYFTAIGVPSFAISFLKKMSEVKTVEPPDDPTGEWSITTETGTHQGGAEKGSN